MDQGHKQAPDQSSVTRASASAVREKFHRFDDGEESITVKVLELPNGEYLAFDNDGGRPIAIGQGFSSIGAIADLFKKLPAARSEQEERGALAQYLDHKRDLRKHEVA